MNPCLNNSEKKWLRYYIGDVSGNDSFWAEPKAYLVLNSMFYDGIETEKLRASEGKFLNPAILDDVNRLLDFYDNMFSAFKKCHSQKDIITYRVERYNDFLPIKNSNHTISFTSTSINGFLDTYCDRKKITLIKFFIPKNISCINLAETLDFYSKPEESEILLPPFMCVDLSENVLTEEELLIVDSDGYPPENSYMAICRCWGNNIKQRTRSPDINGAKAGQNIYNALNNNENPNPKDIETYTYWKKDFIKLYMN